MINYEGKKEGFYQFLFSPHSDKNKMITREAITTLLNVAEELSMREQKFLARLIEQEQKKSDRPVTAIHTNILINMAKNI